MNGAGDRIEALLAEIRSMSSAPTWARVEELVRLVVELYGSGLTRIVEILQAAQSVEELPDRLADDALVASLLLLHGLHPDPLAERVQKALDRVRPYLGSHGGGVELVSAEPALVRLRMAGSCDGCASSSMTQKMALETAIREAAPEVLQLEVEGVVAPPPRSGLIPVESLVRRTAGRHDDEGRAAWVALEGLNPLVPGQLAATEAGARRLVVCRTAGQLYAYRDGCPACGSLLGEGVLAGDVLTCPRCGERYDVRRAGRSLLSAERHLEPVPLLEDGGAVRVALA